MKVCTDACLFGAWTGSLLNQMGLSPKHMLDIGTGTGLLSLMLTQALPNAHITAIEIDTQAAGQAQQNFKDAPWSDRMEVITGDVCSFQSPHLYSFIISNPPFFEQDLKSPDQQRNLALHDAGLTLATWWQATSRLLEPNGHCALLLPSFREMDARKIAATHGFHAQHMVQVHQTERHQAFRSMLFFGREEGVTVTEEKIIISEAGTYTNRFTSLLSPFYLKL